MSVLETMHERSFRVSANDGKPIFCVEWIPEARASGAVQIAHGMAEHCLRYRDLAAFLTSRGYAVFASDHRGHGHTVEPGEMLGHFGDGGGWDLVLRDLRCVSREITKRHPDTPLILFGHSMGSFLARAFVLEHPDTLCGLIISATGIRYGIVARVARAIARLEAYRVGPRTPSGLMARLSFGAFNRRFAPNRTSFDWLSRDPKTVDLYVADPLCGFACTAQLWVDQFEGIVRLEAREKAGIRSACSLRALLFAGDMDPVSRGGRGIIQLAKRYRELGIDVETRVYPGGRHEMLNEINREEVYNDIATWLGRAKREAPTPAHALQGGP